MRQGACQEHTEGPIALCSQPAFFVSTAHVGLGEVCLVCQQSYQACWCSKAIAEVLVVTHLLLTSPSLLLSFAQDFNLAAVDKLSSDGPAQRGTGRLSRKISLLILGHQQCQAKFPFGPHLGIRFGTRLQM